MPDAVVHRDDWLLPNLREHPDDDRDGDEGRAHSRAFSVTETVQIRGSDAGLVQGLLDDVEDDLAMVLGGLARQEAGAGGGDVGFTGVAEDVAGVRHDADSHLVRGAFEAHRELDPGGLYVSLAAAAHRACVCEGEARQ